ncbi:polysaccharide deacetylase family protein [Parapedobacter sp. 10938]|uniref:polysaccharide deacetylase family protein n=1 Tax=Parapedobacter flavus TaxID=3110225 RepID=UPI002DB5B563|nr:polysaccharide deacetylase family protein [Parapedobacter sp. 10938]MEC3879523.1 polysaccharide deacetylase family protein [Parapedobacter sp. 10938]
MKTNTFNYSEIDSTTFDVVLGFDMETDIGSYTPFYEGVKYGSDHLLSVLEKHGIPATFYWTGHAAETNPDIVRRIHSLGHETGCHGLFHETLGDPIFPLPNNWPILESEVEGRLVRATSIIKDICGTQPVSFRCPRLWGSTTVANVLEKLGYVSDASLPLYFYGEPLTPYHPSSTDWTKRGNMKLLEIPNFCDMSMETKDPYQRDRDQWPLYRTKSASYMMDQAERFVDYVNSTGERPVLCFYLHPWEFFPMPQGAIDFGECSVTPLSFITENCGPVAVKQLDVLCGLLKKGGGRFLTASALTKEY